MNFLQLCQRLAAEAQIAGTVSSVSGQSGILKNVVDWVVESDRRVQLEFDDWDFRWLDFSFSTVAGTRDYPLSALGLRHVNLDSLRLHTGDSSLAWAPTPYTFLRWGQIYRPPRYDPADTGKPTAATVTPPNSLRLSPTPDAAYTVSGFGVREVVSLEGNADEPLYPVAYHLLPVWRALMDWGGYFNAPEAQARGAQEYELLLRKAVRDLLPFREDVVRCE